MLNDTRAAPVFGSQEFMEYQRHHYRVCDYALAFLKKVAGHDDFAMQDAPTDRDRMIANLAK